MQITPQRPPSMTNSQNFGGSSVKSTPEHSVKGRVMAKLPKEISRKNAMPPRCCLLRKCQPAWRRTEARIRKNTVGVMSRFQFVFTLGNYG